MSACCPRCQKALETGQVDAIQVRLCQGCRGLVLAHPDLAQVLESSWRAVSEPRAEETPFHAREGWQNEAVLHCPECRQPMEKYGYMGLGAILIDRCDPCSLVWLDTDELQNMVLALAKSSYRSERARRDAWKGQLDLGVPAKTDVSGCTNNWLFERDLPGGAALAFGLLRLFL